MSVLMFPPSSIVGNAEQLERKPGDRNPKLQLVPVHRVTAIQTLGKMKGTSAPLMMRADDGHAYVVKLTSNPYGPRIVVNEYLAVRLARGLGLSTPEAAIVSVPDGLGAPAGLHFGSRIQKTRRSDYIQEWIPSYAWKLIDNPSDVIGAYVLDAWTANSDCRQFIFARRPRLASLRVYLIDHGHCFGGYSWRLHGIAVQCPVEMRFAYSTVTSWSDFDPWLTTIENLGPDQVQLAADEIPEEWLMNGERTAFKKLLAELDSRRLQTRALIASFLDRSMHPFSSWRFRSSLFIAPSPRRALGKTA